MVKLNINNFSFSGFSFKNPKCYSRNNIKNSRSVVPLERSMTCPVIQWDMLLLCLKVNGKNLYLYINKFCFVKYLNYFLNKNGFINSIFLYHWGMIMLEHNRSFFNQCVRNRACIDVIVYTIAKVTLPLSNYGIQLPLKVHECEQELNILFPRMRMQSGNMLSGINPFEYSLNLQACLKHANVKSITSSVDEVINLLENLYFLVNGFSNAKCFADKRNTFCIFFKLCTGKPIFSLERLRVCLIMFDELFGLEQQSEDYLGDLRFCLDQYENLKHTQIYQKLYKFIMFGLSASLFEKIGISFDVLRFSKISQEAIKRKYHMGPDFVHSMLDTITFICERGYQCMVTGSISPIFHSGSAYELWVKEATEIKQQSLFLSNPEPHNIDVFSYLAKLNDLVERGDSIYKFANTMGNFEKKIIKSLLNDLQLIKADHLTKKSAQQERKAPFSVLLYGGSSVAKSTMTKLLYYQYGKLFGLPVSAEYKYTRNPADQFWVNFNSTQWCVQLDDIAFLDPNSAPQGDPSLMEMLQVVNNVPFVPIQADLSDKGRTPLKSRFVIATTNVENLNAYAYFSCPLAVQRRLPFIIDIKPKPEYTKDTCMLNGEAVPNVDDGNYPDYWIITVKRVIPVGTDRVKQKAAFETLHIFDNILDFIQWFSHEAVHFESLQDKALSCDEAMQKVVLCDSCYVPQQHCRCVELAPQSQNVLSEYALKILGERSKRLSKSEMLMSDISNISMYYSWWEIFVNFLFSLYVRLYFSCSFFHYLLPILFGYTWMISFMFKRVSEPRLWKTTFRCLGARVQSRIGYTKQLITLAKATAIFYGVYKTGSGLVYYFNKEKVKKGSQQHSSVVVEPTFSESIGSAPIPVNNERENVWYKDDYVTTSFDVSSYTTSLFTLPEDNLNDLFLRHSVYFISHFIDEQGYPVRRKVRGTCVAGHIYVTNNHALPEEGEFKLEVIICKRDSGVTSNLTIMVTQDELHRFPDQDLVFIRIRNIPPRRNIARLFCKASLRGNFRGKYIGKSDIGEPYINEIENISFCPKTYVYEMDKNLDTWMGTAKQRTVLGDCGSLMLAFTGAGPVILGIHVVGAQDSNLVGILRVTEDDIVKGINSFSDNIIVQSGVPLLSSATIVRKIRVLDSKSPLRYLEKGTANVYGSFEGFRAHLKSKVDKTLICESMLKRGYQIQHGPPVLKGWKPWRLALQDMVRPVVNMNNHILEQCTKSFIKDILSVLTIDDLKLVHVYDDVTAINGAPGVAYVDKINRNTSAGNPWKKSKKYYLTNIDPIGEILDPVKVDKEIMDRVDLCIKTYHNGERYMPNFCAHLKDEATAFSKIESGKTRVFTGAPFDWTIVVRKYLLSVVRLIQNKRFVFESAPGTIAQSTEWQEIYQYLTEFGDDRIVAGDYGKFDKRMPSTVILAAYDIIIAICRASGYSELDLLVVQGIAEDTAFPLVDFNGDLVEFFGCNPSGHPLTVIINGLANSLYMRYCYAVLSPEGTCKNFKKHVNLMTYGDDNIMGISKEISFFNHSTIQEALAKIDIEYTMADKEQKSIPFINIKDGSFLKRTWIYDNDVGAYLCPLEHSSINKMLCMCVVSKTVTPQEQAICIIETALREYFFYGKNTFNKRRSMFQEVIEECNLELYLKDSTLPTYSELCKQFWENSQNICVNEKFVVQSGNIRSNLIADFVLSSFVVICFYVSAYFFGLFALRPKIVLYAIRDVGMLVSKVTYLRVKRYLDFVYDIYVLLFRLPLAILLVMLRRRLNYLRNR